MDRGYLTILALLLIGVVFGLRRKRHPQKKSHSGWVSLGVIAALLSGLFISYGRGDQTMGFMFGLALMAVIPIMFFVAIGAVIVSALRRAAAGKKDSERGETK
jgi:peptidoglycan/LPS O-acetylase OafA/YrhL